MYIFARTIPRYGTKFTSCQPFEGELLKRVLDGALRSKKLRRIYKKAVRQI